MIHKIKILAKYYKETASGNKLFEIRVNDRNYQKTDKLILREFDGDNYTGKAIHAYITYVFAGGEFGLADDHCILGIRIIDIINPKKNEKIN